MVEVLEKGKNCGGFTSDRVIESVCFMGNIERLKIRINKSTFVDGRKSIDERKPLISSENL